MRREQSAAGRGGVGGTVASESALRSAGTFLSRVRAPPPAPWPDGGPESLRSPCWVGSVVERKIWAEWNPRRDRIKKPTKFVLRAKVIALAPFARQTRLVLDISSNTVDGVHSVIRCLPREKPPRGAGTAGDGSSVRGLGSSRYTECSDRGGSVQGDVTQESGPARAITLGGHGHEASAAVVDCFVKIGMKQNHFHKLLEI
ncbi:hypothetical protein PoB_004327600 [Plakobranchus ocellatus]|uniref:Uncharacterized protein n=1 Tax=Plakobranchus ocellatus TaxID=259542 RepID=A0AAV4BD87_9GAST|nr:hypothetical protein PoB_004327600 [Plakobranchus ocellatus]